MARWILVSCIFAIFVFANGTPPSNYSNSVVQPPRPVVVTNLRTVPSSRTTFAKPTIVVVNQTQSTSNVASRPVRSPVNVTLHDDRSSEEEQHDEHQPIHQKFYQVQAPLHPAAAVAIDDGTQIRVIPGKGQVEPYTSSVKNQTGTF